MGFWLLALSIWRSLYIQGVLCGAFVWPFFFLLRGCDCHVFCDFHFFWVKRACHLRAALFFSKCDPILSCMCDLFMSFFSVSCNVLRGRNSCCVFSTCLFYVLGCWMIWAKFCGALPTSKTAPKVTSNELAWSLTSSFAFALHYFEGIRHPGMNALLEMRLCVVGCFVDQYCFWKVKPNAWTPVSLALDSIFMASVTCLSKVLMSFFCKPCSSFLETLELIRIITQMRYFDNLIGLLLLLTLTVRELTE